MQTRRTHESNRFLTKTFTADSQMLITFNMGSRPSNRGGKKIEDLGNLGPPSRVSLLYQYLACATFSSFWIYKSLLYPQVEGISDDLEDTDL